jgi:hypothetical protein
VLKSKIAFSIDTPDRIEIGLFENVVGRPAAMIQAVVPEDVDERFMPSLHVRIGLRL